MPDKLPINLNDLLRQRGKNRPYKAPASVIAKQKSWGYYRNDITRATQQSVATLPPDRPRPALVAGQ